jgi:hypothetical protein
MTLLIQSAAGSIVASLETTGGTSATGLATTDVQVDLKKSSDAFFSNKTLTAPVDATADIGTGANGTVTVAVPGSAGSTYTVEVTVPGGTSSLLVTKVGVAVTVALAVSGGTPVGSENTATLVAAAIVALGTEVTATASGTGVDPLTGAEGPTSLSGGVDGDFTELGGGSYELDLTTSETDTLGQFFVRISGTTIRTVVLSATVAVATANPPTPDLTIPTTTVFGYVRDAGGSAVSGTSVGIRVLSVPTILHPTTEGLVLSNELLSSTTDTDGFFTIDLVTGSQVEVFIPVAGYKRTFLVPTASTNLFDIA